MYTYLYRKKYRTKVIYENILFTNSFMPEGSHQIKCLEETPIVLLYTIITNYYLQFVKYTAKCLNWICESVVSYNFAINTDVDEFIISSIIRINYQCDVIYDLRFFFCLFFCSQNK